MSERENTPDDDKSDAERIKSIIALVKNNEGMSESQIGQALRIPPDLLKKYLTYLQNNDWIEVKKGIIGPPKISLKKKKLLKKGEKIIPEDEESFNEICDSLTKDFIGVIRLWGESESETHAVGLMVKHGDVFAATAERLEDASVEYGEKAMQLLGEKLSGTTGEVEIYELSEPDFDKALAENLDAILESPVRIASLKITLKKRVLRPQPQSEPEAKTGVVQAICHVFTPSDKEAKKERIEALKEKRKIEKIGLAGGGFNLINFARNLQSDPVKAKRFEELRKARATSIDETHYEAPTPEEREKRERIQQLKDQQAGAEKQQVSLQEVFGVIPRKQGERKDMRLDELKRSMLEKTEKITVPSAQAEGEKIKKTVQEGVKIETNIDKLYQIVEKYGKIRINDALAAALKVTKVQIEEWAMILEEHGLLELRYPTIGEPEIIIRKSNKKQGA